MSPVSAILFFFKRFFLRIANVVNDSNQCKADFYFGA